jgi:uncharacterized membrane-anchored protein
MLAKKLSSSAFKGCAAAWDSKQFSLTFHRQILNSCSISNRPHSSTHNNHNNKYNEVSRIATPGSRAFVDCELFALVDLFNKYALPLDTVASNNSKFINQDGLKRLMNAVGESPTEEMLQKLFEEADADGNGVIDLDVSGIMDNNDDDDNRNCLLPP